VRESERAGAVHGLISTLTLNRAPLLWTAVNRALPRLTHIRSRSTMLRSASSLQASTSQRHAVATGRRTKIVLPRIGFGDASSRPGGPGCGVRASASRGSSFDNQDSEIKDRVSTQGTDAALAHLLNTKMLAPNGKFQMPKFPEIY